MNSERKEVLKTINKIRALIMDLKFVYPQLPYGLRLLYSNNIDLANLVRFKLNATNSLINKHILVNDYLNKVLAIYHTTNEYTLFKIKNIKFGKETKANWLKLLSMFELDLSNLRPFNDLQCELRKLDILLTGLNGLYEKGLKDNVLQEEIKKVENLLSLSEEVGILIARPKTQKLLDAFHNIENKYRRHY